MPSRIRKLVARASGKVWFRSGWTCPCVAKSLPVLENYMLMKGLIHESLDIFQLGYRTDVGASAGTHAAGGCTDIGQYSDAQIQAARECGWTFQHRTPAQGFSNHAHGWPWGCTHLSPAARSQAVQWLTKQNGLVSHGRVSGMWPVPDWKTALQAKEKELTAFADDIVKRVVAELHKQKPPSPTDVATRVLLLDGLIPNSFTGNPANKFVALTTALSVIGQRLDDIEAKLTPPPSA